MDRVENLADVVRREVADYVSPSPNSTMYFFEDAINQIYTTVAIPHKDHNKSRVVVMARVAGDQVIIDVDITLDKPLSAELIRVGVPAEKIVLAYRDSPAAAG